MKFEKDFPSLKRIISDSHCICDECCKILLKDVQKKCLDKKRAETILNKWWKKRTSPNKKGTTFKELMKDLGLAHKVSSRSKK